ncbi:putative ribonuclease H-like domain-containing protein [Tanacetum coccineum]
MSQLLQGARLMVFQSSHNDGSKHSNDDGKKVDEFLRKDSKCKDQEKEDNVNSTNIVNVAGTNKVNAVGGKISIELPFDPNMPTLEDYSIFDFLRNDEDDVIGDLQSATQTRKMSKNLKEHRRTQKGNSCIEGSKLDRGYAGRASTIQVTRSIEAIRLFLAYASFKDFVVYQMDVKSAFLYGKIKEEVYACQPPGFEDPNFPDRVYKVEKALYVLLQALRAWYETLSTYLLDNGFHSRKMDKTLFIKMYKDEFYKRTYILLRITSEANKDGIFISEDKYVDKILKKFGFTEVKTASTLLETQKPLLKDEDGEEVFWSIVKAKTINGEAQLHALVDGKKIIIIESSVRRDLQLADEEVRLFLKGVGCRLVRVALLASSLEADKTVARVESSNNDKSLGDDASKQGRNDVINADEEITLVSVQNVDEEMFDVNVLDGEKVFVAEQEVAANEKDDEVNVVEEVVEVINTAKLITDATTVSAATITTIDDITLAQALMEIKSTKPKEKGAKIDADYQLAERMQAQEQEELFIEEKMFDRAFKRVNTFEDFRTELVEGKEMRAGTELV